MIKIKARRRHIAIPRLKQLFTPCPICGGTTDVIDWFRVVVCHSCGQEWNIFGDPLEDKKWLDILALE